MMLAANDDLYTCALCHCEVLEGRGAGCGRLIVLVSVTMRGGASHEQIGDGA